MLFKEVEKELHTYNAGGIVFLHKHAYYGDLRLLKKLVTSTLLEEYFGSIYYCIDYGCKKNFEFAEFFLNEIEFIDRRYKMSITSTYMRNGKHDPKLYLEKFDYTSYRNITKEDVEGLVEHKDLHNTLYFISVLNSFELSVSPTDLSPTNKLKYYYNLPNSHESKRITDFFRFVYPVQNIDRKI